VKIIDCVQKSPEWFKARCGIPTASAFNKIITSKGKPSEQRTKYLYQLAGELITQNTEETYQNANMLRGIEIESEARSYYALINDVEVEEVGFCLSDGYGASPDGFVGNDGIVQFKCPIISTHVGYILEDKLPTDYFQQVQGELLVTGRKWCDFVSYYPGLKPFIFRVSPDKEFISKLEAELKSFCSELRDIIRKIR
jgi:hypothetical protein